MFFLRFLLSIFSILLIGYSLLRLFFFPNKRLALGEIIVLSFGIGTSFVSLETISLSFIKGFLNVGHLLLFQLIILIAAILKFKKDFIPKWETSSSEKLFYSWYSILFFIFIAWEIIYVILEAGSLPFNLWDAWGNWGLKAKIIFSEKNFPYKLWTEFPWIKHPAHLDYPLLVPFAEAYIYLFLGKVYDPLAKVFCSLHYFGLVVLFYYYLKRKFNINFTLGCTFCLVSIPNLVGISPTGYMEPVLIFYVTGGILYIKRYLEEKDNHLLLLGTLFIGLGMLTKNEGLSLWLALFLSSVLLTLLFRLNVDKKKFIFFILFIPLLIYFPWFVFKQILGLKSEFFLSSFQSLLKNIFVLVQQRLPLIFNIWIKNVLDLQKWNVLWVCFPLSIIWFLFRRFKNIYAFFLFIVMFQMIFNFIIYIIWPVDIFELELHILNSLDRLLTDIAPLSLLFICEVIGKKWQR